jgi:hypothetical protein
MTTWTTDVGSAPTYWLVPVESLPDANEVVERIRALQLTKAVALVGYEDDAHAGEIAKRLPYGLRGEGIEENVFCRVGSATGEVVQFADDAWPGEDRTYVVDDVTEALALAQRFATEYGAEGAVVVVTGGQDFVSEIAGRVG